MPDNKVLEMAPKVSAPDLTAHTSRSPAKQRVLVLVQRLKPTLANLPGDVIPVVLGEVLKHKDNQVEKARLEGYFTARIQAVDFVARGGLQAYTGYNNGAVAAVLALDFVTDAAGLKRFLKMAKEQMSETSYNATVTAIFNNPKAHAILEEFLLE